MSAHVGSGSWKLLGPDIQLYCDSDTCGGMRFFSYESRDQILFSGLNSIIIRYQCRNCTEAIKIFAVNINRIHSHGRDGTALKIGEYPPYGPSVPPRVISLISPDRDIFLKGRRAENQGLGIGAFAYYRRVIENQKGRLIREMGKVAERLGSPPQALSIFERAANETQFSKAVNDIKDAIPQSLLVYGQNPLSLLYGPLSEGLHAQSDEKCLELAQAIRIVLTELAERISQALKDEAELKQAVRQLLQTRNPSNNPRTEGAV
jgi:hypothetical protein